MLIHRQLQTAGGHPTRDLQGEHTPSRAVSRQGRLHRMWHSFTVWIANPSQPLYPSATEMQNLRATIERNGYAFAVLCIAVATAVFFPGRDYFAKGQWALLYLLMIGLVAGLSGVRPAFVAAVLAFFAWNYFFLPPYHTFTVDDPKDWLSLFAFLIVGISMGAQTGRLREREAQALAREREMERLRDAAVRADALRQADELKSTLISSVSHELKTPLSAATATVSNLLEQDVEWEKAAIREELETVQDDLLRLNSSIGGLLDLSRLEAESWSPEKDSYEFGEIVGTAVSRIPIKLRSRIAFDIPDDMPAISVDFVQWTRVVQNLLENALAYSPANSPVRVGAAENERCVLMWVEDQGQGIAPDERERVFEKFYRGKSSSLAQSGTGLGLAITREIVGFHGGSIFIQDASPHGTRMVIELPKESL